SPQDVCRRTSDVEREGHSGPVFDRGREDPPSTILRVPYGLDSLRTKTVGRPVTWDITVAIGMPPISIPASRSQSGRSAVISSATSRRRAGCPSNKYLSKYSDLTRPERRLNSPTRWTGAIQTFGQAKSRSHHPAPSGSASRRVRVFRNVTRAATALASRTVVHFSRRQSQRSASGRTRRRGSVRG